jgi:hypothetical protein
VLLSSPRRSVCAPGDDLTVEQLQKDDNLAALRDGADFKELLEDLRAGKEKK